jgi:hypothetical protein
MTGITLADAQTILTKLIEAQKANPSGTIGSVQIGTRSVTFRSAADVIELINYWQRMVATLSRAAAGRPRHGRSVATFRGCR